MTNCTHTCRVLSTALFFHLKDSEMTGNRFRRMLLLMVILMFAAINPANATLLVDFSPDTTGAPTTGFNFIQCFLCPSTEVLGDTFTLPTASTITGGSIFSYDDLGLGGVGTPVRFVILPDVAGTPGATPLVDATTTLDLVDKVLTTTQPQFNRLHATIAPQGLAAGTYWFYIAGIGINIGQETGNYDDNSVFVGTDANPDLEAGAFSIGDNFFTLEGSLVGSAPEPSTLFLLGTGLFGLVTRRRRRRR